LPDKINTKRSIAFIGAGRFGRFFGEKIAKFANVVFFDPFIEKNNFPGISFVSLEDALKCEIIFLAIPISVLENFLQNTKNKFRAGCVLIDLCSVKIKPLEWMTENLDPSINFVLSHPLFGPDSAKSGLDSHKIYLRPGRIDAGTYMFLVSFFTDTLKLKILNISPEEHDRLMAYNLCLVHFLGRSFHEIGVYKLPLMMAGMQKLRGISEVVMNDSPQLFRDLCQFNPFFEKTLQDFITSLDTVRKKYLS